MIGKRTEEEVVAFIDVYWLEYWTSPSYQQIGDFTGLKSKSSVTRHLNRLVQAGVLEKREQPDHRKSVLYRRAT